MPGETYCYRVEARKEGEYFLVSVKQSNAKVYATLCGPGPAGLMKIFAPFGTNNIEPVSIVTSGPGEYIITIEAPSEINKDPGEIYVELALRRTASARDRALYDAEKSFARAEKLRESDSPDSQRCAAQDYIKALAGFKNAGDLRGEAQTRNYLAYSLARVESYKEALTYLLPATQMWKALSDAGGEAEALNNEAFIYMAMGDSGRAMSAFERARLLHHQSENFESEVIALSNLGGLYLQLGRGEDALQAYKDGLEAFRKVKSPTDPTLESNLHKEIGRYHFSKGDFTGAAEKFQQALKLLGNEPSPVLRASILNGIAAAYLKTNDPAKAFDYFDKALKLYQETGQLANQAIVLNNYGSAYLERQDIRDLGKATDYFLRAMAIFDKLDAPYQSSGTLFNLARAQVALGKFQESKVYIEEAINMLESLRVRAGPTENRQALFAQSHFYYDFYVSLLMYLHRKNPSSGFDVEALRAAERSRGRTLLDLLSAAAPALMSDLSDEEVRLIGDAEAKLALTLRHRRQALSGGRSEKEMAVAEEDLRQSMEHYESLERRWSRKNAALLIQLRAPTLPEMRELLDEETLALEFYVVEDRTVLWAISKDGPLYSTTLPIGRAAILSTVEQLRDELTARTCFKRNETEAITKKRIETADNAYLNGAAQLSRKLLGPISSMLASKRLAIVADGALQLIPFAALPSPSEGQNATGGSLNTHPRLLIEDHEIVNLPSLSTLARVRELRSGSPASRRPIVIFADPVFSRDDERLTRSKTVRSRDSQIGKRQVENLNSEIQAALKVRDLTRGSNCLPAPESFERLPGTLLEANSIRDALKPQTGAVVFKSFEASLPTFALTDLTQFRVVHIASHAYVPPTNPEQARLIFSLIDSRGREQKGSLGLPAIHDLKLNADMVTLSACETGVGKDVAGEGLVGLARGFMYAGTPRVTASLWKVKDRATAELMSKFYREIFAGGKTAAGALRKAQLKMYNDTSNREWNAPFYWSAFILQGDWR